VRIISMKLFSVSLFAVLLVAFASTGSAESKMSLSVGGDVLLPMGDFGDAVSTGFGGSVRFQYDINPMASVGLTSGYYIWSGKEVEGFSAPDIKGIPIRAFGKYYFMPKDEKKPRVYGILELGVFLASADVPAYEILGTTYGGGTETSTDFNWAPGLGVEIPLGGGKTAVDISARYDAISAKGGTNGSIAARVGVNFMLGN
jgi:hypothetical protein